MLHRLRAGVCWLSCLAGWCIVRRWEPLCLLAARKWGPDCVFCKLIAGAMREPHHCRDLMSVPDVIEWLKRR